MHSLGTTVVLLLAAASELCTRLTRLLNDNEASLIAARTDREERSFNQSLRDEQDQAYLESLKADQEKVGLSMCFLIACQCASTHCM